MSRWCAVMIMGSEAREVILLWKCHWGEHIYCLLLVFFSLLLLPTDVVSVSSCGRPYPIPCRGKEAILAIFKGNTKKMLFHTSTPNGEHSNRGDYKLIMAGLMEVGGEPVIIYCQVSLKVLLQVCYFPPTPLSSHTISNFLDPWTSVLISMLSFLPQPGP